MTRARNGLFAALGTVVMLTGCGGDSGPGATPIEGRGLYVEPDFGTNSNGNGGGGGNTTPNPGGTVNFQPASLYFAGTLQEGCQFDTVAQVSAPNTGYQGFTCEDELKNGAAIRPTDNVLVYVDSQKNLREFVCDFCPFTDPNDSYPVSTRVNDTRLTDTTCNNLPITRIEMSPEGDVWYRCGSQWYDEENQLVLDEVVPDQRVLIELGSGGNVLVDALINDFAIFNVTNQQDTGIGGLPLEGTELASRVRPAGGFFMVFPTSPVSTTYALYQVTLAGTGSLVTTYGAFPPGFSPQDPEIAGIDSNGDLYRVGRPDGEPDGAQVIVRQPADGSAGSVVYNETSMPVVQVNGEETVFISGP
ncbi:MAG: hypothetical protein AAFQ82_05725 [Myxococcota bacterium]